MTAAPASFAWARDLMAEPSLASFDGSRLMKRSAKFTPPMTLPIGGMMMSLTTEVTTLPKATPIITPTARSTTLPLRANSLNSFIMLITFLEYIASVSGCKRLAGVAFCQPVVGIWRLVVGGADEDKNAPVMRRLAVAERARLNS